MNVTTASGMLKKFRRTPWRFQQTVKLPEVSARENFVSAIIEVLDNFESATVTIDEVVFDTVKVTTLCPANSALTHDTSILAQSTQDLHTLLIAAFWDGSDFVCIPTPKPFVFYADHHDFVTFYANTKSNLNSIIKLLTSRGYELVRDWQRDL
jgi:hypothetical protein